MNNNNDNYQDDCYRALTQSFQKVVDGTTYMLVHMIVDGLSEIEMDEPTMKKVVRLVVTSGTNVLEKFNDNIFNFFDSADDDFNEDDDADNEESSEDELDNGDDLCDEDDEGDYIDEDGSSGAKIKFVYK